MALAGNLVKYESRGSKADWSLAVTWLDKGAETSGMTPKLHMIRLVESLTLGSNGVENL